MKSFVILARYYRRSPQVISCEEVIKRLSHRIKGQTISLKSQYRRQGVARLRLIGKMPNTAFFPLREVSRSSLLL
jgi:hypothetical protein